jgi:hypothetical protein
MTRLDHPKGVRNIALSTRLMAQDYGGYMSKVLLIVSALLITLGGSAFGSESQKSPADEFARSFLEKHASVNQSLSPEIARSQNPHVKPFAAILEASRWPTSQIFVCWENPDPALGQLMEYTKDAVQKTWERHSALKFVGWQKCAPINAGIHIKIEDVGPHVKTLGHFLDKMNSGMVLNFTFKNWSTGCQQAIEDCVRAIAVHEFGHAIGFAHEQNRPDAPGECRALRQGTDPDKVLTAYDKDSVMNYCNKKWNNDGMLSKLDIEAVQTLYGKPQQS